MAKRKRVIVSFVDGDERSINMLAGLREVRNKTRADQAALRFTSQQNESHLEKSSVRSIPTLSASGFLYEIRILLCF